MHNFCLFVDSFLEVASDKSGGGGGGEEGAREGGSKIDSLPCGYADSSRALFLRPISPPLCSLSWPCSGVDGYDLLRFDSPIWRT